MDSPVAGRFISNFDYPILIVTKSRKITNLSTNVTQISIRMIPAVSDCAHESHTLYVHRKLLLQLLKRTRKKNPQLTSTYRKNFDYPILIGTKSRKITNLSTKVTQISIRMIPAAWLCAYESHTMYVHRKSLLQLSKRTRKNFRAFYVLKKSKFLDFS